MSATRPAVPDPTEIAERYVIEKKLGAGAFGTVYKARDKKLRRLVAIKTIRLEGLAASSVALEDLLKRFEQEAEVAARVQHPNIVALWDIGTWEGLSYISMEFVDGVGLDRVIQGSGKMAVERAASIGAQIAEALNKILASGLKSVEVVTKVSDPLILNTLAEGQIIPVIAPIGAGPDGETFNINADTVAGAIAGAVNAARMLLLTDVAGVLDKSKRLLTRLSAAETRALIADGTISGGMIPKVETCIEAIERGVEGVVILNGKTPHSVLLELFTEHGAGTLIVP